MENNTNTSPTQTRKTEQIKSLQRNITTTLLPVTYKILTTCIINRVQEQLQPKVADYEAGYRPNILCIKQNFNLKSIIKLFAIRSKLITCTFVNLRIAYD